MKVLSTVLLAGFLGFLLGLLGCEKSPGPGAACAAEITARLDLTDEPSEPCSLSVVLFQTTEEVFYSVSSMNCYLIPRYYTCTGDTLPYSPEEARRRTLSAEETTFLGFYPQPVGVPGYLPE